jgi:nucleoside-triphosphatase THEP1
MFPKIDVNCNLYTYPLNLKVLDIHQLTKIYEAYGFEVEEAPNDIAVYAYRRSRYFGVDIIPLSTGQSIMKVVEQLKTDYSNSGYATTIKNIVSVDEAKDELFKSFFSFDATRSRLQRRYGDFVKKQSLNLLGSQYQYISSPYEIFNAQSEDDLIILIKDLIISSKKANLIIIEAAAGYGKTSTAYQILDALIESNLSLISPILTELARNRGAKIFRYILLDEIDKEFPTLNSDLVIKEIHKGRVPLIIDGFDELLDKVNIEADISSLDEIEPMLNTIGNLLEEQTQIVLTTRKTAIFNDYEFEQWISKWDNKFDVIRISIKEPSIEDWLGEERCRILDQFNIPLHHLANPVMLAYLRNLSSEEYISQVSNGQNLVDQYFQRMLVREQERQNLLAAPGTQLQIFRNVVGIMLEFDITSEKRDFFKELIKDSNLKILESTRSLYPEKPTIDNLVDKLANHALLDRKGRDGNHIGFINDFVLGVFIGEIINETETAIINNTYSSYMIELAVTAYRVQSQEKRYLLWSRIMQIENRFSNYTLFIFDVTLLNCILRSYTGLAIKEMNFVGTSFTAYTMHDSIFINCSFKRCHFDLDIFEGISFINCHFILCDCEPSGTQFNNYPQIITLQCSQIACNILKDEDYEKAISHQGNIDKLELDILDLLWGYQIDRKHYISAIIRKIHNASFKRVSTALQTLEQRGLIALKGSQIQFQLNRINEIKSLMKEYHGEL